MSSRDSLHGFDVLARAALPEYRAQGTHLRHAATGCEVVHLAAEDAENLFAFSFATPPADDTGVAHIIEHSVLSGSRRYPVKEPFSTLMKGSMYTFLNALTYPDRTIYPAASCNRADFFNLLAVYGDSVFHPLLRPETFAQEAWRLEEDGSGSFRFAGIVYNEMKGARASADAVCAEWMARGLLPGTPYAHDSGGDPARIPELTLEAARRFHARWYHPSNCRVFLYGNIPLDDVLARLQDAHLEGFARGDTAPPIAGPVPWTAPRMLEKTYAVKPGTDLSSRSVVSLGWLLSPVTDSLSLATHEVLSEVLVESAGSPLRKALVDSGLGEDLSPVSGLETDLGRVLFAAGLRGTDPGREGEIAGLVEQTLSRLASGGLDARLVESMMNRVEIRHREIRGGGGPYALRLMGRTLRGWTHGADPFASLSFAPTFAGLRERVARDPSWLPARLRESLVDNPHRLTLVVRPDPGQEAREAAEERARLDAVVGRMGEGERAAARAAAAAFRAYQEEPDAPEHVATVPALRRADLPRVLERIPTQDARTSGGIPLSLHDIFTNDVVSIDVGVPTGSLRGREAMLLPLLGRAVTGMGLPGMPYDAVSVELFRLTGGFSSTLDVGGVVGRPGTVVEHLFFRLRCLRANLADASALAGRLLAAADFRDTGRLGDLLVEMRNDMKSAVTPAGHQLAMLRAGSMVSPAVAREETWRGVSQLQFLDECVRGGDAELARVAAELEALRAGLLRRGALVANATATSDSFAAIGSAVDSLAGGLPAGGAPREAPASAAPGGAVPGLAGESLVCSASVACVARAVPGVRYEDPLNAPVAVLGHLLSTGWLWEKVRMEGGAYGAFSFPRATDGIFLFGSYRDPHIARTLEAFEEGLHRMAEDAPSDDDVEKAVIGTVGREDRPIDPGDRGFVALQRALHGLTDEGRQARRDTLLQVGRAEVARAAAALRDGWKGGFTSVIAGRAALEAAAAARPEITGRTVDLPE